VRSTTDTSTVGTLKDIPVNLLLRDGSTFPTASTIPKGTLLFPRTMVVDAK